MGFVLVAVLFKLDFDKFEFGPLYADVIELGSDVEVVGNGELPDFSSDSRRNPAPPEVSGLPGVFPRKISIFGNQNQINM